MTTVYPNRLIADVNSDGRADVFTARLDAQGRPTGTYNLALGNETASTIELTAIGEQFLEAAPLDLSTAQYGKDVTNDANVPVGNWFGIVADPRYDASANHASGNAQWVQMQRTADGYVVHDLTDYEDIYGRKTTLDYDGHRLFD